MEEIPKNMEETIKVEDKDVTSNEINTNVETEQNEGNVALNNKDGETSDVESVHSKENYSVGSHRENSKRTTSVSEHSCTDSEASVILEREEGDGQESIPPKKVDDDEDKKNPQYIPKRGTFYEHDDRTAEDIEEEENKEKIEKEGKKKVWQEKKEKWNHDRFNDNEQAPKSKQELISIYGYDIRSEEGPPRARRRRRYGRGPNKYTRNWEDEDAYSKPPLHPKRTPRKKTSSSERSVEKDAENNDEGNEKVDRIENSKEEKSHEQVNLDVSKDNTNTSNYNTNSYNEGNMSYNNKSQRVGSGRVSKPKRDNKRGDEYSGFTRTRNFETKNDQKIVQKHVKKDDYIQSQNFTNRSNKSQGQDLDKEMNKLSINEGGYSKTNKYNNQRQVSVPPRLQNEQKGSKRYSSIRQRSLPETANPPFNQHSNFYPNEFSQQNQSNANQQQQQQQPQQSQGIIQHQNSQIHTTPNQMPQIPPPPLPPIPQQVPVTSTPILQAPPQFAPSYPQPPPNFLQPGVAPPPFIPQQTPQIINYVQGQPQFPQAPFHGFQQQFNTVSQPTELYQPQGGITYYSPQDQPQNQRTAPAKRPKAAIPILPPPAPEPRGRGRSIVDNSEGASSNGNQDSNNSFEDASSAVTVEQ